jgi:hypothetical protein
VQVEAQGLGVLFVDIQALRVQFADGIAQQAPAHASATLRYA